MSFSELQFKKTKFALALIIATHGNIVLAQTTPSEVAYQDSESDSLNEVNAQITWPLLSGESVESLAVLFYPKNKKMQRLFISKTLQLSREINPNLNAFAIASQASLIIIPNIKLLAKYTGKIKPAFSNKISKRSSPELHMSYQLKDAAKFAPSPEQQARYEDLVKRNALLKQKLEKLDAKLAHLQQVMVALNVEAILAVTPPKTTTSSMPEPVVSNKNKLIQLKLIKNNVAPLSVATIQIKSLMSPYLIGVLGSLLTIVVALLTFRVYRNRKPRSSTFGAIEGLQPMAVEAFSESAHLPSNLVTLVNKVSSAQTADEYSGSLSDNNLDATAPSHTQDDGKLVLEQAYDYVSSSREIEAIALLKAHIQSAPSASIEHYLYLLDIYRATNQKEEFLLHANKFHQGFNVMTPQWENSPVAMVIASSLEEFPHIADTLIALWAEDEETASKIKAYLDELLTDNRNSERVGFSMEVLQEIILLRNLVEVRGMMQ